MKITVHYSLILDLLGDRPNAFHSTRFNSLEEAIKCWEVEFKNRDKKDGYDEYWRQTPLRVQRIIEQNLWEND